MAANEPIGLIAGAGRLPVLVADGIIRAGKSPVIAGLSGFANPILEGLGDSFAWTGLTRTGSWIRFLKRHGVKQSVMIGSVRKADMYLSMRFLRYLPDLRTARLWYRRVRKDRRDNAVLLAVADELSSEGIELMSSVEYCREHLASEGTMTSTSVPSKIAGDIEFGWKIARAAADLDIGQAMAVKDRDIIAVEAVEGTDQMIKRAGQLCKSGNWTLLKVARSNQDMRFDVPTVGPDTIKNLKDNGCCCLVVEAEKTLIVDREATLKLADHLNIAVTGIKAGT